MDKSELEMLNRVSAFGRIVQELEKQKYIPVDDGVIGSPVIKVACPICGQIQAWFKREYE